MLKSPKLSMLMPPPSSVAVLLENVDPVMVTGPPSVYRPPPPAMLATASKSASPGWPIGPRPSGGRSATVGTPALLPVNTESVMIVRRSALVQAPPPSPLRGVAGEGGTGQGHAGSP